MSRVPCVSTALGASYPITRRRALSVLLATTMIASLPPDASLAGGKTGDTSSISGDTYVGRTADPDVFVAVVLGEQQVTVYVCDGLHQQVDHWFYGPLIEDLVELAATDGARLVGLRSSSGIDGWVMLPDSRRVRFFAELAGEAAGLYAVSVRGDGRIHGESSTGAVLDGEAIHARSTWDSLPPADAPADWQLLELSSSQVFADGVTFAAQLTLPDGRTVPVGVWTPSKDPGPIWVILLADGEARGHDIAMATGAWVVVQDGA